ncbi:Uncharacterised protein [Bordetella pertussis]|nr:Uncharacterised protein [Bordetella pertussis]
MPPLHSRHSSSHWRTMRLSCPNKAIGASWP